VRKPKVLIVAVYSFRELTVGFLNRERSRILAGIPLIQPLQNRGLGPRPGPASALRSVSIR